MKNFHDYFFDLTVPQRIALAEKVGTTRNVLTCIAGGFKRPSMGMATRIVRASGGDVTYEAIMEPIERRIEKRRASV